jgi:ABC-2 type transport system ATP-binding protein
MNATVELHAVSKRYGSKVAVDALSLAIAPGTMFGLLGPNGAGKTSSIRMITGITLPDSGSVSLFGQPFSRQSLRRVGYLPEERGLYRKMPVRDQLIFMGQLHGLSRADSLRVRSAGPRACTSPRRCQRKPKSSPKACSRKSSSSQHCCTSPN